MEILPFKGFEEVYKSMKGRHAFVYDACPAVMNGEKGYLGVSTLAYSRVWFDTKDDSKTLYSSFSRRKAIQRYGRLKKKYGVE